MCCCLSLLSVDGKAAICLVFPCTPIRRQERKRDISCINTIKSLKILIEEYYVLCPACVGVCAQC
jgi:hypothetical protein